MGGNVGEEPESLILRILGDIRAEMANMRVAMATKEDVADLRSELRSLRADVASDLATLDMKIDSTRKDLSDQIVGLRRAVVDITRRSSAMAC